MFIRSQFGLALQCILCCVGGVQSFVVCGAMAPKSVMSADASMWAVKTMPGEGEAFAWCATAPKVKSSGDPLVDQERESWRAKLLTLVTTA